jgi:hypothetical protein
MFSGLNKVVDRGFIVGFAMPALLFLFGSAGLWRLFGLKLPYLDLSGGEPLKDTTMLALMSLAGAFLLMILNWNILRIMEGYWYRNLGKKVNWLPDHLWTSLDKRIAHLNAQWRKVGDSFPKVGELRRAREVFSNRYPVKRNAVLPTRFGNALRAFEDYPREVYGIDSIPGWIRLNAVMSKDYRELADEARADMNTWMNIWFLTYCLLAEYAALAWWSRRFPLICLVVPALIVASFLFSGRATKAAVGWGEWVKGAFDIYIIDLLKKLGYRAPTNLDEIREICHKLSQTMIYRTEEPLKEIEKYREGYATAGHLVLPEEEAS